MALTVIPMFPLSSSAKDKDDHTLVKLWQEYYAAQDADKPQTQLKVLEKIKAEAGAQHLTWDYYDACDRYMQVSLQRNWKLRDSLNKAMEKEITDLGEPVAVYYLKSKTGPEPDINYIYQNAGKLRNSRNMEFWKRDYNISSRFYGEALPEMFASDYDYCLWSYCRYRDGSTLVKEFREYPLGAIAEFEQISGDDTDKLAEFAGKYKGKAAGLLAEQQLLNNRFNTLEQPGSDARSSDFEALRDDCMELNSRASSFSGTERKLADCCKKANELLKTMNSKGIEAVVRNGVFTVGLQNLDAVTIKITGENGKKVFEKYLTNPIGSYYLKDKLLIELPVMADGTYNISCKRGDITEDIVYNYYTISTAMRFNADGAAIWAADYISGEPLKKVTFELLEDGKVVESAPISISGFTPVPASINRRILESPRSNYQYRVRCSEGRSRLSKAVSTGSYYSPDPDDAWQEHAAVITDRGAYSPGDILHFKAVLYRGRYSCKSLGEGVETEVELRGADGKIISTKTLKTNEFGSIAGDFTLERRERNGSYTVFVRRKGGRNLGSRSVQVDDFILPTFDLVFDRQGTLYFPVDEIKVAGTIHSYSGHPLSSSKLSYRVEHYGKTWSEGELEADGDGRFAISFEPDSTARNYDWYSITVKAVDATGETMEFNTSVNIRNKADQEEPVDYYFKEDEKATAQGRFSLELVAGNQPVWVSIEVHGTGNKLLRREVRHIVPRAGEKASTTIEYKLKNSDPDAVCISVLYFQNRVHYSYTAHLRKELHDYDLPLSFTRFLDTTAPGGQYSFEISTAAGVECAAAIFDLGTERFRANKWTELRPERLPIPYIRYSPNNGNDSSMPKMIYVTGMGPRRDVMSKATMKMVATDYAVAMNASPTAEEDSGPVMYAAVQETGGADIIIRENFANTIAWEPFLRSDANGKVQFNFTNADKLSTYNVQVFALDKDMRNAVMRREMVVTIPVKISLVEPQFLYEGDVYKARIALSSSLPEDVWGTLSVQLLNGSDHKTAPVLSTASCEMLVPGKGTVSQDFVLTAPDVRELGVKVVFRPEDGALGSDGVFVCVPVSKTVQSLTEAHSALLHAGADKAALEKELRAMFTNIPGDSAEMKEISVFEMLGEAIPEEVEVRCDNAIELSKALYAYSLCEKLGQRPAFDREKTLEKLNACKAANGGFAWFAGMEPSPIVTAVVLTQLRGLGIIDEAAAVKYIDSQYFAKSKSNWWYRGLSMEQYLQVRSMFPEVPFTEKTEADWRKEAKEYLVPKKARGLNGRIGAKARRVETLENLLASERGNALAKKLGIKLGTAGKLRKSLDADIESLVEYAQPHKSGGCYYPNVVMPWRGLLESELDAHCTIARIMDRHSHSDISDGIRLWIMVQKETQAWKAYSGYLEALALVLNGPDSILQTKVLALKGSYDVPFAEVKAAGNGMGMSALAPAFSDGSTPSVLKVGDRIRLSFEIKNDENRSFVKLTIPFGAGLVPVNQLSGYRWGCYRNVLSDRIELWYEVYPEEKTTVSEEFFVTRAGVFQSPAAEIVCEYADHYRANTAAIAPLTIEQ